MPKGKYLIWSLFIIFPGLHTHCPLSVFRSTLKSQHEPCFYLQLFEVQFLLQHLTAIFPLLRGQETEETFPFQQHLGKLQLDDKRGGGGKPRPLDSLS